MPLEPVILTSFAIVLLGALPLWPYSRGWGYGPSIVIGLVLLILLAMALTGRVPAQGRRLIWRYRAREQGPGTLSVWSKTSINAWWRACVPK